jgi:hypothetical protein
MLIMDVLRDELYAIDLSSNPRHFLSLVEEASSSTDVLGTVDLANMLYGFWIVTLF